MQKLLGSINLRTLVFLGHCLVNLFFFQVLLNFVTPFQFITEIVQETKTEGHLWPLW